MNIFHQILKKIITVLENDVKGNYYVTLFGALISQMY